MNPKLPYYMAYPMPLAYDDEKLERRDFEYMKSLYSDVAKKILPHVEEECDRMEYDNSMMYDEYPDKLQLRILSSRVYENVRKDKGFFYGLLDEYDMEEEIAEEEAAEEPQTMEASNCFEQVPDRPLQATNHPLRTANRPLWGQERFRPERPSHNKPPQKKPPHNSKPRRKENPDWLRELIDVMLYQELFKRRCDNRRCRRRFY